MHCSQDLGSQFSVGGVNGRDNPSIDESCPSFQFETQLLLDRREDGRPIVLKRLSGCPRPWGPVDPPLFAIAKSRFPSDPFRSSPTWKVRTTQSFRTHGRDQTQRAFLGLRKTSNQFSVGG